MDDLQNVLPDTQTPETEGAEQPLEELALPESVESAESIDVEKLKETNKKLYARTKKAEETIKKFKEKPAAEPASVPKGDLSISDFLTLRKENYTDVEIAEIADEAANLGVPVAKVLSNPTFKAGIEYKRNKAKIEQATPNSSRSATAKPNKPLGQMTPAEREAWFAKKMGASE